MPARPVPAVSIVMPVRDAAATLDEALASIAAQDFPDYELIAVLDGGHDASRALLYRAARADRRIRVLDSPQRGIVGALNAGLLAARAPLVARMDADDRMHPQRLARQVAALREDPALDLVAARVRAFPEAQLQAGMREYLCWQNACLTPADIARDLYVESPFAHPSVMYRRAVVLGLGGYRHGLFPEDYELWLRMAAAGRRMRKLPEVLVDWRDGPARTSRRDPRCSREAFDRLRAHYLARDPRLAGRELAYWGAGRRTRRRARHLIALGLAPAAWIDIDPRKIGNRVAGAWVRPRAWLAREPRPFVLCYVARHGAREVVARDLDALGYRCGSDYLMVG